MLEQIGATRYVAPLREGGSLPAIMEADDLGTYVVKFRGAGQGLKALVAEVVVAELARRLGFAVPELKVIELDVAIAKYEPDEEVQDLLNASIGANLAMDFLPGAFGWDSGCDIAETEAGRIIWLDAFTANVDRSWQNPNLLLWHHKLWLIDHGAALYFHHSWPSNQDPERFAHQSFDSSDHALIARSSAGAIAAASSELTPKVSPDLLADVVAQIPAEWLDPGPGAGAGSRQRYVDSLLARARAVERWLPKPVPS